MKLHHLFKLVELVDKCLFHSFLFSIYSYINENMNLFNKYSYINENMSTYTVTDGEFQLRQIKMLEAEFEKKITTINLFITSIKLIM